MTDSKENITWMKTVTASTRVDVETPIVNLDASAIIASKWTGATWTVLKDLKNHAASGLSGTKKLIEVDIEWTPYYFEVYPTKE